MTDTHIGIQKDTGGRSVLRQVWTSFVKARLNCSIPAQQAFYFDNIRMLLSHCYSLFMYSESVTKIDTSDDTYFYASMSSTETAFTTSAVCRFSLSSINRLFDHGLFAEHSSSGWLPLPADAIPKHRPGRVCHLILSLSIIQCTPNSQSLSDTDLHFAKSYLMMYEPVSGGTPIIPTRNTVFTSLAVDRRNDQNIIFAIDGR